MSRSVEPVPTPGLEPHGSPAFDPHGAPDLDLIDVCIHCGFCLPTCPTYALWGEEMDSPRGRIALMRHGLESGSEMREMAVHFDRCLGCMACVTACPSGVQYDRLIEATRPQVERNAPRSFRERAFRRALFEVFTHPGRLRALAPALAAAQRLGLPRLAGAMAARRLPRFRALLRLARPVRAMASAHRLPAVTLARGGPRGRVAILQGCVQRVFFGDVNAATVRVLAAEGFEVHAPRDPRCCGALQLHSGHEREARDLARRTIAALDGFDLVVANAAGCGSAMKGYVHVLADDDRCSGRAASFSAKVRDVSELLAEVGSVAERHPIPLRLAYHDACHLAHAQGIRKQPRALLAEIPGVQLVEPAEWELCCGSAGLYNILEPEAAEELGRRKVANLLATGAQAVTAANPGCVLQIRTHIEAAGLRLPVLHPMEILDASIRGALLEG